MTKQNIVVEDYEDKKTQAGARYTRFKTSNGWMSCFVAKEAEALKQYEGKEASVEIKQAGKFSNIERVYGPADNQTEDQEQIEVQRPEYKTESTTDRVDRAKALELATQQIPDYTKQLELADKYFKYITTGE